MQYVLKGEGVEEGEEKRGDDHIDERKVVEVFVGGGAFAFEEDGREVQFVHLDHVQDRDQNRPEEAK